MSISTQIFKCKISILFKYTINKEKIQRKVKKIPTALKNMKYEDRQKKLGLTTLEERRKAGDLMKMYKVTNGYDNFELE